jgi:hypothetical protein
MEQLLQRQIQWNLNEDETFDLILTNTGNAAAHNGILRVDIVGANARLNVVRGPNILQPAVQSTFLFPYPSYLIPFTTLRAKAVFTVPVAFSYPKGTQEFSVKFTVDEDEIDTATSLGALIIRPVNTTKPQ